MRVRVGLRLRLRVMVRRVRVRSRGCVRCILTPAYNQRLLVYV